MAQYSVVSSVARRGGIRLFYSKICNKIRLSPNHKSYLRMRMEK